MFELLDFQHSLCVLVKIFFLFCRFVSVLYYTAFNISLNYYQQLAQSCYLIVTRAGIEPTTTPYRYTTKPTLE